MVAVASCLHGDMSGLNVKSEHSVWSELEIGAAAAARDGSLGCTAWLVWSGACALVCCRSRRSILPQRLENRGGGGGSRGQGEGEG